MRFVTGLSIVAFVLCTVQWVGVEAGGLGSWKLLVNNSGIASMHTAVTRFDTCILLDRTNVGPTGRYLENGVCRNQPLDKILPGNDCYAHSVMFRPDKNTVRSLFIFTDTWCSSGQFMADGTMWQTGGDQDGNNITRTFTPCPPDGTCDWVETTTRLTKGRWYSTNHILPEGTRQIVIGGRGQPNYEFVPKRTATEGTFYLPFISNNCCENLYPFVFLLPNGELFIFLNTNSIRLNYVTNKVTKNYPTLPGNPRNYPSGGSGVMLPLSWDDGFTKAEILVCGGAAFNASTTNGITKLASKTCGRIDAFADALEWTVEEMPIERVMNDMVLLPDDTVLIINGARNGFQGWGKAINPVLFPVGYNRNAAPGSRFTSFVEGTIPRMYHATANLLVDGRVMCAGSNSNQFYTYNKNFPTELRVDAFSPPYLSYTNVDVTPHMSKWPKSVAYGQVFVLKFTVKNPVTSLISVVFNSAPFVTHSFSQGQRQLKLLTSNPPTLDVGTYTVNVTAVPNSTVAPPGYYMCFVLNGNIPSRAKWIQQTN